MTVRLSVIVRAKGLLHPDPYGSLRGLSSSDACLALTQEIWTLQRPRPKVSALFLMIQAGFDNVYVPTPWARQTASHVPSYIVNLVSSFPSERTGALVFHGSPNIRSTVSVGTPQGSLFSLLLFLIDITPLHILLPRGLMVSKFLDLSITVASPSHRGNIRHLQRLFSTIATRSRNIGVSFSVPKTELLHLRYPSPRTPPLNDPH